MATFKSILSRGIFAVAVFCLSFSSMGAIFAPFSPSFQGPLDPMRLSPPVEARIVSGPTKAKSFFRRDAALGRLTELVLTERAITTSA